ncbi:uncharacterized protein si:dkey-112a7.4 [Polypterus senegalus]|uniref:uncharacterized protein si:dkey-112a7.4 n=1 Tax=Polypterus senegalus TaxID=55291 RepID=UPI001966630D|nr:uncharacterized protein si:dkey-112a7.4 [Polypterus senegalus]XP_039602855.1 uncharacterized protein si:dkey-112a7.4 [Polypterus senegalus]
MLYCCANKPKKSDGPAESDEPQKSEERRKADGMYDAAGPRDRPEDAPPQAMAQPAAAEFHPEQLSFDSPQRRLGKRAPKLGVIGRSKKVVIEDEDLDDVMNNNGLFPLTLDLTPIS